MPVAVATWAEEVAEVFAEEPADSAAAPIVEVPSVAECAARASAWEAVTAAEPSTEADSTVASIAAVDSTGLAGSDSASAGPIGASVTAAGDGRVGEQALAGPSATTIVTATPTIRTPTTRTGPMVTAGTTAATMEADIPTTAIRRRM